MIRYLMQLGEYCRFGVAVASYDGMDTNMEKFRADLARDVNAAAADRSGSFVILGEEYMANGIPFVVSPVGNGHTGPVRVELLAVQGENAQAVAKAEALLYARFDVVELEVYRGKLV
jgi:hypothetical protein